MKRRPRSAAEAHRQPVSAVRAPKSADRMLTVVLIAFAVVIPLIYSRAGNDSFEIPKELLFRAEAIIATATATIAWLLRRLSLSGVSLREPVMALPLAAVCWTAIATAFSTSPASSLYSLLTVVSGALIFLLILLFDRDDQLLFPALFLGAGINAVLAVLQEFRIWNPFASAETPLGHSGTSGLMGNPNVVGTFLVAPAIAALAAALTAGGRKRLLLASVAAVLIGGLVASLTLTAMIGFAAATFTMVWLRSRRLALVAAGIIAVVGFLAVAAIPRFHSRLAGMAGAAKQGHWQSLSSNRLTSFVAAAEMGREHPLTGVGPGRFFFEYYDYKLNVEAKYNSLLQGPNRSLGNFGEVHNDHLQTFAETGIPGYLLMLGAMILLARVTFRAPGEGERGALAQLLALPLVVGFAVTALAQFPLQNAAPRLILLTYAALILKWSRR